MYVTLVVVYIDHDILAMTAVFTEGLDAAAYGAQEN